VPAPDRDGCGDTTARLVVDGVGDVGGGAAPGIGAPVAVAAEGCPDREADGPVGMNDGPVGEVIGEVRPCAACG
jgi:hypothetical protein